MVMLIDCDQLVSMSGCVTPPPPVINFNMASVESGEEGAEVATPKFVAQMDGIVADALNSKLQQLQDQDKMDEARVLPDLSGQEMTASNGFAKLPLPALPLVAAPLPPPPPHAVQRPPKDHRPREPEKPRVVISRGSVGHPVSCAAACRYVKRKGGCRDGADCLQCHECFWSKAKDGEGSQGSKKTAKEVVRSRKTPESEAEDLTAKFVRLLSTEEPKLQPPPLMDMMGFPPGLEAQLNPGSMGHPFTCGPACKYVLKTRGCKDGGMCNHCHLCRWSRYSKTLKL